MKSMKRALLIVFLVLFFSACDYLRPESNSYEPEYVVEASLVANHPLPRVELFTSVENDENFSWGTTLVGEAIVEIHLMDNSGDTEQVYPYRQVAKGKYESEQKEQVLPSRTYELIVTIPEDDYHQLRAQTTVPSPIKIISHLPDTAVFQSDELPTAALQLHEPRDNTLTFLHEFDAKKPFIKNLTPYYQTQASEDTMSTYWDFATRVLDMVNGANYAQPDSNILRIHFPWKDFAYYGPHSIAIHVIDDNLYDHIRSANAQFGSGNLGPGQLYNVIDHVEGGLGVFGSIAVDTTYTFVKRP